MSLKYFVNLSAPQTFARSPVCYYICIKWQTHIFDASGNEFAIPLYHPLEDRHIEVGLKDSSGQRIAGIRTSNNPINGAFKFVVNLEEKYVLEVHYYVNEVVTYTKAVTFTVAVRIYEYI